MEPKPVKLSAAQKKKKLSLQDLFPKKRESNSRTADKVRQLNLALSGCLLAHAEPYLNPTPSHHARASAKPF